MSGKRPPAVREENSPVWDLSGVDTDGVAIWTGYAVAMREREKDVGVCMYVCRWDFVSESV